MLSFRSSFDIIGPEMIGPSSSHTAGAAKIGLLAKNEIKGDILSVVFTLYGSFAATYRGHGTDRALLGGILGFEPNDARIKDAYAHADKKSLKYNFIADHETQAPHPNTVDILLVTKDDKINVRGISTGGGSAELVNFGEEFNPAATTETRGFHPFDFTNGAELLKLCKKHNMSISQIMFKREAELFNTNSKEINEKMQNVYTTMKNSVKQAFVAVPKTLGGLIGGEAIKMDERTAKNKPICGEFMAKAVKYAMGVIEISSTMGLMVACPTAGSSGVVPGAFLALQEEFELHDEQITLALFNAAAIGHIITENASVSGAVAGCQAEVGSASAMAAAAICEVFGAPAEVSLTAASIALSNLLGLVCDPVAGLVEEPCQKRNAIGVSNALISAEIALAGVGCPAPFDEMVEIMMKVGQSMPDELRETARGGMAIAPTVLAKFSEI